MRRAPLRLALAFLILFALYQAAEGVGARLLGSAGVQGALMIACVAAAWPVGRWLLRDRGYRAYALEWRRDVPLLLGLTFAAALLAKLVTVGILLRTGALHSAGAGLQAPPPMAIASMLIMTAVPSIAEDILTRGFWWRSAPLTRSALLFVPLSALIYLFNHVFRLGLGPMEWLRLFIFGLAYAAALARTGSLWATFGLHWGWNFGNFFADAALPTDGSPGPWASIAAHVALLAFALLLPRRLEKASESLATGRPPYRSDPAIR